MCVTSGSNQIPVTVSDNPNGSKVNYRASADAYDNCSKPLRPDDVDLTWKNGSYTLNVDGADTFDTVYFYTPSPNGNTTFEMQINWQ